MSFGDYLENEVLGAIFGQISYYTPWISVGLSSRSPEDDGYLLNEPSAGDGYIRVQTEPMDWDFVTNSKIANTWEILFDEATGDWGLMKYFVLFDEDYYGTMLLYGELDTYRDVTAGHRVSFIAGQLEVTLT